jgi:hypothetical protein
MNKAPLIIAGVAVVAIAGYMMYMKNQAPVEGGEMAPAEMAPAPAPMPMEMTPPPAPAPMPAPEAAPMAPEAAPVAPEAAPAAPEAAPAPAAQ